MRGAMSNSLLIHIPIICLIVFVFMGCSHNRVQEEALIDLQKEIIALHKYNLKTNRRIEEMNKNSLHINRKMEELNKASHRLAEVMYQSTQQQQPPQGGPSAEPGQPESPGGEGDVVDAEFEESK